MWMFGSNVDVDEEMEYRRDDVYQQILLLVKQPVRYLSASIKKALWKHFTNFNFGYDWVENGEELLQKTKMKRVEKYIEYVYFYDNNQDNDEVNYLAAEYWEEWLVKTTKTTKTKCDCISHNWVGHRAGLKRDKFALWSSREKPTRHKLIKLAKRQPAQQSVQQ